VNNFETENVPNLYGFERPDDEYSVSEDSSVEQQVLTEPNPDPPSPPSYFSYVGLILIGVKSKRTFLQDNRKYREVGLYT
jgi:hypothetical protein